MSVHAVCPGRGAGTFIALDACRERVGRKIVENVAAMDTHTDIDTNIYTYLRCVYIHINTAHIHRYIHTYI